MPNVKATADVSVWNTWHDREKNPGPQWHDEKWYRDVYFDKHKKTTPKYCVDANNNDLQFANWSGGENRRRSACLHPNSTKSQLVSHGCSDVSKKCSYDKDKLILEQPCPHASSSKYHNRDPGRHTREHKLSCTYDSLSSANLVEFSKNENYNKHSRQGKDGQTLYQQLVKQYCQDYRNLFEVVEGNDNKTCLQLSNNPHSSKTLGEELAHLENMITEEQKQQFCNENPSYEWCGVWNLLKKDGDRMFCEKDVNKDYPGCKEYRKRLDTIYEKNKDQYNVVKEVGKQLPHCAVPEVWATDKDVYMPTNKTEVLRSCPSTVTCIIANNFTDANMQNTNFYNNATCNTEVNNNVTLVDGAGDSEASASSTNIFTQASPSGVGSYSGSNTGTIDRNVQSSSSTSTSEPSDDKDDSNMMTMISGIAVMFMFLFMYMMMAMMVMNSGKSG